MASAPAGSAPNNITYPAVSVSQSFTVFQATLNVTATSFTILYGQTVPTLTYTVTGFVNGDSTSVVTGAPVLSTTATAASNASVYPISATVGTLAATNYSFVPIQGTLTIQQSTATISISNIPASASYGGSFTPIYAYTGGGTPTESVVSNSPSVCTVSSGVVKFVGLGSCSITASATATTDDKAVTGSAQTFTVGQASATISVSNLPASAMYGGSFTPTYSYTGVGTPTESVVSNSLSVCTVSSGVVKFVGAGSCSLMASATATTDDLAATGSAQTFTVGQASATISVSNLPASAVYGGSFTPTFAYTGIGTPSESVVSNSLSVCTVSSGVVKFVGVGSCSITASATATTDDKAVTGISQTFTVGHATATISVNNIPASAVYGGSFTPTYSYTGVGTPTESVVSNSLSVCTVSSGTVKFVAVGTCSLTASATATTDDLAATGSAQAFTVGQASATISVSNLPASAVYGGSFTPTYSYSGIGKPTELAVSNSPGVCTVSSGVVKFVGVGTCSLTASATATTDDKAVTGSSQSFTVGRAAQTITFTIKPPTNAAYNSSFTVAATSSSGLPVTFTSSGVCRNSGAVFTMTSSTGTCSAIANQAGNADFTAAPTVIKDACAIGPVITVSPTNINFGTEYLNGTNVRNITVKNTGTAAATISTPFITLLQAGNSDEFVAVNLCPHSLAAGKSCTITVAFHAGAYYSTARTAMLKIVDSAPGSPQVVDLTAIVINPVASISPTSLSFGTVKYASGSSSLNVTLSNTGATPLIFSGAGISITGNTATAFSQTNACGTSLAAGAKCTIAVKFKPAATGKFSARLTVADNAHADCGTQSVALSGTGN